MSSGMKKFLAVVSLLVPFTFSGVVGFAFLAVPEQATQEWEPIVAFSELPANGDALKRAILEPDYDAWQRRPDRVVDHVFVRRGINATDAIALATRHTNCGVSVEYDSNAQCFRSVCYDVRVDLDGRVIPDKRSAIFEDLTRIPTLVIDGTVYVRLTEDPTPPTR